MASPPFNLIIERIPEAQTKLERAFNQILNKMLVTAGLIVTEAAQLSVNVKCSDPMVVRLKQLVQRLQQYIKEFIKFLGYIGATAAILAGIAKAAVVYLAYQNTLPIPTTPGINAIIGAQEELLNKILDILKKYGPLFAFYTAKVVALSIMIAPAVALLSQICQNDAIEINKFTQDAINKISELAIDVEGVAVTDSKFYQDVNVSESDIKSRQDAIDTLISQQRSLLDLIEAPSQVIIVATTPSNNIGKTGDFAIDKINRIIYGPKPSESEWNEGINY